MVSLTLRATAIFVMALAFLVLSPGRHASAAPVMVDGPWAAVFSTSVANAGDCQGGITGSDPSRASPVGNPWICKDANGNTVGNNGTLTADLTNSPTITGWISFTAPAGLTITFRGTLSNDGASASGTWNSGSEFGAQCTNATDDDFDGVINDGCPAVGAPETGAQCINAVDDDADAFVNDGCPTVLLPGQQQGTFNAALQTHTGSTPPSATVTDPNAGSGFGASLTFGGTTTGGNTAIITAPTSGGPLPPQFQLEGQYYHVITTNTTGTSGQPYIFCAGYVEDPGPAGFVNTKPEGGLMILHWDAAAGSWHLPAEPRYNENGSPPASNVLTNTVCASVDHLSEFALVAPSSVGGLVSIVGGGSSSGVSTWLWAATAGVAIAVATAGGWLALGRRRLR